MFSKTVMWFVFNFNMGSLFGWATCKENIDTTLHTVLKQCGLINQNLQTTCRRLRFKRAKCEYTVWDNLLNLKCARYFWNLKYTQDAVGEAHLKWSTTVKAHKNSLGANTSRSYGFLSFAAVSNAALTCLRDAGPLRRPRVSIGMMTSEQWRTPAYPL